MVGFISEANAATGQHATHWVDSWAAVADSAGPAVKAKTILQVIRTSVGGPQIRVRLSNLFGEEALILGPVGIARRENASGIQPGINCQLTFHGHPTITIAKGADVLSDAVDFPVGALEELTVSIHVPRARITTVHGVGLQTAYIARGNLTGRASVPVGESDDSRYFITDLQSGAPAESHALVLVGDSIVDGIGSTQDANARWSDALAVRLHRDHDLAAIGVINSGLAGNRILRDGTAPYQGPSLLNRFDRDVMAKPGVKWILILEGINDISASDTLIDSREHVTAEQIIEGMHILIERAHARGLKIWASTLLPYKDAVMPPKLFDSPYFTASGETKRQVVNQWIRTAHAFDAVVDLDMVMRDPEHLDQLKSDLDSGDHLHPNDAGYKEMAAAIDRQLFLPAT